MWFSFANEAEEGEGNEVVVVNALGAGAGRFVLASVYFPFSLFSVRCYYLLGFVYGKKERYTVLGGIFILLFCVHYKER
ncbi:hypothetical protein NC653_020432 [Populus alba x Populus x berolinensis]|uniref:Uncharacterized protein n=1 Tax=Populus alba x Populus x berolinensis TaxID=444605 RepID=A0AAD6MMS6_9ROSI|nr:hypothetical protein NC653_020432 [Populus alba x Populus x berolinensis]